MDTSKTNRATDRELLDGLMTSKESAVRAIYDLVLPSVIYWIKENSGTESDARDIFQDALLALYRRLEKGDFELTCTLKSYIRIMCRNLWLTKIRDSKKWKMTELDGVEKVDIDDDMTEKMEKSAQSRLFYAHFEALDEKCKNILHDFFQKVPLAEIAKKLDTSVGYIKKRKFLCKEKLVQAVQNDPSFSDLKIS